MKEMQKSHFKVDGLVLYKNHHRTILAMKKYVYHRILRKCGNLTFTIQHVGTEIEEQVHTSDIQLARGQTKWDIDPYVV